MGFDLWDALGVSPLTGLIGVVAAVVVAALLAGHTFWRNRTASRAGRGLSLHD
jgi:hypothetical protein